MADERELIAERERKVAELRAAGRNPYANGFAPTHTAGEVLARFVGAAPPAQPADAPKGADPPLLAEDRFTIAGRIIAHRGFGKATFVKLADRTGELQVYVKKDKVGEANYDVFKKLERGDFIGATGPAFITKTGELTLMAESFEVLTKAIRPLPEKWHGLQDVELRYRQRYVDLIVNPAVRDVFRKRSAIIRTIRQFLDGRGYLEVETPILQSLIGGAAARPFRTHHNALD